jgi:hypothetical protein
MHRPLGHELGDHGLGVGPGDGRLASKHLVEHGRQRVHVASRVEEPVAGGLFRTHVLGRAQRKACLSEAVAAGFLHGERDAEVGQHRLALEEQDVLGLDVAVHNTRPMGIVEGTGHLLGDGEGLFQAELLFALELVAERLAADQWKDVEEETARLARVDQSEDVGVVEPRRDLDLGQEALGTQDRAKLGAEDLKGHFTIVLEVGGEIDRGHAAGTELSLDAVAFFQGVGEAGGVVQDGKDGEGSVPAPARRFSLTAPLTSSRHHVRRPRDFTSSRVNYDRAHHARVDGAVIGVGAGRREVEGVHIAIAHVA